MICFYALTTIVFFVSKVHSFNCYLPNGCRIEDIYMMNDFEINQKDSYKEFVIMCNMKNEEFEFKFNEPNPLIQNETCFLNAKKQYQRTVFRSIKPNILEKHLNFTNVNRYFSYFERNMLADFWGLKGFEVNFLEESSDLKSIFIDIVQCIDCRFDFYYNKRKINSCEDMMRLNLTDNIGSFFQIEWKYYIVKSSEFRINTCPLVFSGSLIDTLEIGNLENTFYKRNILTFSNHTFPKMTSYILFLRLHKLQNINLDLDFLNPSVFSKTMAIYVMSGSLNSVNGEVFNRLSSLRFISFYPYSLKKLIHKQGLDWIKQINNEIRVNLSDFKNVITKQHKEIIFESPQKYKEKLQLLDIFPEEDFCVYVNFPFNQLVIPYDKISHVEEYNQVYSCTYLWLVQYYEYYYKYFELVNGPGSSEGFDISNVINLTAFKSISKCNFEQKQTLCNRSNYQIKDYWDRNDFFLLNKKFETVFKISLYLISLMGLVTNLIVVIVILKKDNSDLFKECKQYSYLWLNSIFSIMISVIEILSWMTECFYPFEVFCPEIRKLVAIQFFNIIFKECLVTMFRFMCNFTYIAFALNRIGLIGKDHGKVVTFISEVGIKKYIAVTLLISLLLSWIKFFKYEVNYFYPHLNFPISNELDIVNEDSISSFKDFYFAFNSISDVVNYFLFVVVCIVIDICMVVQLRRTLDDKAKKSESMMSQQHNESKKAEFEEVVNKAIEMVLLNSSIGVLFKIPVSIISIINLYADIFYRNRNNINSHPTFGQFYSMLFDSGLYYLIQDVSHFLFSFSLSIQMFIYKYFDNKFAIGFDRLIVLNQKSL